MLVSKYRFFLLHVLIWSILMLGIKIRAVLKSELNGLHKNVQHFNPRCNRSRNITVDKADTVLRDTLYKENFTQPCDYLYFQLFFIHTTHPTVHSDHIHLCQDVLGVLFPSLANYPCSAFSHLVHYYHSVWPHSGHIFASQTLLNYLIFLAQLSHTHVNA